MTHQDPVLLVLPRSSWDALARTADPAVRLALDSLVQVDTCLHAAIGTLDGVVREVVVSVHLDAAEEAAHRWAASADVDADVDAIVRTVPVELSRTQEVA